MQAIRVFAFFLFVTMAYQAHGTNQIQSDVEYEELERKFFIYDEQQNDFKSYSQSENTRGENIFYPIDFSETKGKTLVVEILPPIKLFLDNRLLGNRSVHKFNMDSLYRLTNKRECFLVFHFGEEEIDLNKIKVSFKKETLLDRESSFKILPKSLNFFSDFILLGFLSLLILVTLSKTYAPKNFKDITAFDRMYSLNIKEENIFRNGIFSYHNGYMIILFSLLASFSYCIIFSGGTRETFSFYLSNWLFTAIVVAIVVVFKMIIMGLFSRVYNMGKLFEIHYYEYLRFSILASFAVAVFSLIVGLSDMPENIYHLLASAWIIMIILRVSIVFFKLNSVVTYQYFHLFSYICATEILPFFWLVQSGYHFFG